MLGMGVCMQRAKFEKYKRSVLWMCTKLIEKVPSLLCMHEMVGRIILYALKRTGHPGACLNHRIEECT